MTMSQVSNRYLEAITIQTGITTSCSGRHRASPKTPHLVAAAYHTLLSSASTFYLYVRPHRKCYQICTRCYLISSASRGRGSICASRHPTPADRASGRLLRVKVFRGKLRPRGNGTFLDTILEYWELAISSITLLESSGGHCSHSFFVYCFCTK